MRLIEKIICAACFLAVMSVASAGQANVLDGAKEWNGHYYKIIRLRMNWERADAFCRSMGGHLATAETQAENEMMKQIFNVSDIGSCWLGARRDKQNIWRWISGKIIADYFDWAFSYEPRNETAYSVLCMTADNKGKWITRVADEELPFMCEWESANDAHESNM